MNEVRTRFAPSPTGYMHVGNLRTALYAYLTARHENGVFILRIEDTDQARIVDGAVDIIYNTLKENGMTWDEGPDVGGDYGPYVQSERMGLFKDYAVELVEARSRKGVPSSDARRVIRVLELSSRPVRTAQLVYSEFKTAVDAEQD